MTEQQAFVYLKTMVDMLNINKELNPDSVNEDAAIMAGAVSLLLKKTNKLEAENAMLKVKKQEEENANRTG